MKFLISIPFLIPAIGIEEWPMYWGELSSCLLIAIVLWKVEIRWKQLKELPWLILLLISLFTLQWLMQRTTLFNIVLASSYLFTLIASIYVASQSKIQLVTVAKAIMYSSIILALSGFIQFFSIQFLFHIDLARNIQGMQGIMGQRNLFANYIFCGVMSCLYLMQKEELEKLVGWLILGFLSLALILSGSRTIFLYAVLLIVLIRIDRRTLLILGLCLMIVFYINQVTIISHQTETFSNLTENARFVLAREAFEMFIRNPILGQGILEFNYGIWENALERNKIVFERHSHNLVFQILAECGITGITIVVLATRQWCCNLQMKWREVSWLLKGIIGVQLIHSMVEFPLWYMQWLCLFGVFVGLTLRKNHEV